MKKEMLWKRQKAFSPQDLQLSRSVEYLNQIIWLRFVHFKYHVPLPNPEQPFLGGKLPEQIPSSFYSLHSGFQELNGKPASPTPVIVTSHTANKEEKVGHYTQTSHGNPRLTPPSS